MLAVRTGPIVGPIAQVLLLTVLAWTVGLSPLGWTVGATCGLVTAALLLRALHSVGAEVLGPASWVTLTRATLVGGVTALIVESMVRPVPVGALVGLAAVALALDAVDGRVARRTGTVTALGARFDMEVDAFLILVLSVFVVPAVGVWVLAIGGMRYAYLIAGWLLPALRRPLPPRYWAKVVAAIQGVTLVVAASGLLPRSLTMAALLVALVLLLESFGRDTVKQLFGSTDQVPLSRRSQHLRAPGSP